LNGWPPGAGDIADDGQAIDAARNSLAIDKEGHSTCLINACNDVDGLTFRNTSHSSGK
jgi:hypothetical protein